VGRNGKEFYDFIRDTVWARGLFGAERVDRFVECVASYHVGEGDGGVISVYDYKRIGVVRVLSPWEREVKWSVAGEFFVEVGVDGGDDVVRGVYYCRAGADDFI
jgi:hypothetical protein